MHGQEAEVPLPHNVSTIKYINSLGERLLLMKYNTSFDFSIS